VGFGIVPLADFAGRMRAASVKIAQRHRAQSMGGARVAKRLLYHQFRAPVRIDRRERQRFRHRLRFRRPVNRTSTGEHKAIDTAFLHRAEQCQRAGEIVAVIVERHFDGFAHISERGEVHDRGWTIFGQHFDEARLIENVALFQRTEAHKVAMPAGQIVIGDRRKPRCAERARGVAADISGTAGDKNIHDRTPPALR
jgi:hypothetical protein